MMPSHWFSQGLYAAAVGNLERTLYYLALVWSNGLFLYVLTVAVSRWLYRRGYNRIASGGRSARNMAANGSIGSSAGLFFSMPRPGC